MALKIRLRQQGRTNRQTYRLVVTDIRNPRDGKYLEKLGAYNPYAPENNCTVNAERVLHWVGQGAELSESAKRLLAQTHPAALKEMREKAALKSTKLTAKRRALRREKGKAVKK